MIRLVFALWFGFCGIGLLAQDAPLIRAAVLHPSGGTLEKLEELGYEPYLSGNAVELIVSDSEWVELEQAGYHLSFLERGRPFTDIQAERGGLADYPDLAEVEAQMAITAKNYPNLAKLVDLTETYGTPTTFEGRHLYALKISDNVTLEENETPMLVVSCHHAREIVTPVIALHAIEQFTSRYATSAEIRAMVDSHELWVVPVWNPDGYNEVFVGDNFWRKNRRVFPSGIGVDLNRNYRTGWDTGCSGSTSVTSETYKGPSPASEPETLTMEAFRNDRRFEKIVDFHSHGREVLYAYDCLNHAQQAWQAQEAVRLAQACGYGTSTRPPSADGEEYEWALTFLSYAFLIETHDEFQPAYTSAQQEAVATFGGIRTMAQRPIPFSGTVVDAESGEPLVAEIQFVGLTFPNNEALHSGGGFGRFGAALAPGSYQARFVREGYVSQTHSITLSDEAGLQLDIQLSPESQCEADFNQDERRDILDLALLVSALGSTNALFDLDANGLVELDDLHSSLSNWGPCPDLSHFH